jgi:hypothetical protein
MAFKTTNKLLGMRLSAAGLISVVTIVLAGCAADQSVLGRGTNVTVTDPARLTRSGFLTDYARLKPTKWGEGLECWKESNLNAKRYSKILVSPIVVSFAPSSNKTAEQTIDPSDIKVLTDYFHAALVKNLKADMEIVDQPGPGVAVLRVALTDLVPTTVGDSVAGTLIPYAFIVEAGSGTATGRPAGSTPYLGETGMEMQFRDGVTGAVLSECRDTEIGRKYAADINAGAATAAKTWASGYLNSFQSWSYAKNAFDKWSILVARRVAQLRGDPQ